MGEDGYRRVKYGLDIQIHLIQAMKELKANNEKLEAENAVLRDELRLENASLKQRLAELEHMLTTSVSLNKMH